MQRKFFISLVAGILLVATSHFANAVTIYQQNLDSSIEGHFSNLGGAIIADNFTVSTDATITGIRWYGFYEYEPGILPSTSFGISFYSDNAGSPSSSPLSQQSVTPTITDSGMNVGTGFFSGNTIYEYMAILPSSYTVNSGEIRWLSISDNQLFPQWLWSRASYDGTFAYRNTYPITITDWTSTISGDFAFELIGDVGGSQPVPEPATIALLGIGLAGLAGVGVRRKWKKKAVDKR